MHGMEVPSAAMNQYRMARAERVDTKLQFAVRDASGATGYGCALDAIAEVMEISITPAMKEEAIGRYQDAETQSNGNAAQVTCYDRGEPLSLSTCSKDVLGDCGTMDCELPNT